MLRITASALFNSTTLILSAGSSSMKLELSWGISSLLTNSSSQNELFLLRILDTGS